VPWCHKITLLYIISFAIAKSNVATAKTHSETGLQNRTSKQASLMNVEQSLV